MTRWLFALGIAGYVVLLAVLWWVFKEVDVFFSGFLVLFTGLLFWTNHRLSEAQKGFQKREQEDREQRENGLLVMVGKVRLGYQSGKDKPTLRFWVSNPSPAIAILNSVRVEFLEQLDCSISRLSYKILHPAPQEGVLGEEFPAPVFSGGLTEVRAEVPGKRLAVKGSSGDTYRNSNRPKNLSL